MQITEIADDDCDHVVMCVGHNRGWEEAASSFAGRHVSLQTSCTALLRTEAPTWHAAMDAEQRWVCVGVVRPEQGLQKLPVEELEGIEGNAAAPDRSFRKPQPPAPA
jgi:hypothetical protein